MPQQGDPLAGYTPDWRKKITPQTSVVGDPLATYTPDWRERPGFFSRVGTAIKDLAVNTVKHPIDTALGLVDAVPSAIIKTVAPDQSTLDQTAGLPSMVPQVVRQYVRSRAPTSATDRAIGATQLAATALAGPVAGKIAGVAEPVVGKIAGSALGAATSGAGLGAAFTPNDPLVGATVGGLLGGATGATGKALEKPTTPASTLPKPSGTSGQRPLPSPLEIKDAIDRIAFPASRGKQASVAEGVIRSEGGRVAHDLAVANTKLMDFKKTLDPLPPEQLMVLNNAIESGTATGNPRFDATAKAVRGVLDPVRDQIRALGTGALEHFNENYLPHIWEQPDQAQALYAGKRPLTGSKTFLKERTYQTMQEGLDAGLVPVSYNPVDLTMLKLREMQKYLMGQNVIRNLKENNLLQLVRPGEERTAITNGLAPINDRAFNVIGPREVTVPETPTAVSQQLPVYGTRHMGSYFAPEPVANILNNYLSPGLRGNPIFDAYMGLGNVLNGAQLGISAFHAGMTTVEQAVSQNALAIGSLWEGKPLKAAQLFVTSPVAPLTQLAKGNRLLKEYYTPGSIGGEYGALVDALVQGGGRVRGHYESPHIPALRDAWKARDGVGMARNLIPAALETAMKPMMEELVPRQKLGVFYDLAKRELDRMGPSPDPVAVRERMGKVWDSVDNRMGQIVYDNLFWNKTMKDLMHASVRSVGWNWGTWREIGGGATDIGRLGKEWTATGKKPLLSARTEYAIALPITIGTLGALTTMLMTGKPPQTLKDYFYPPTGDTDPDGNPIRIQLPSYMKDVVAYGTHPVRTLQHKVNPLLGMVTDMLQNEDFYGDKIVNPDDPAWQQFQQLATYGIEQATPFAIRNYQQQKQQGGTSAKDALSFIGLTPAPKEMVRSEAQNLLYDMLGRRRTGATGPEDKSNRDTRRQLASDMRSGTLSSQSVGDAIAENAVTVRQLKQMAKNVGMQPMALAFKQLTAEEAARVWNVATPDERRIFRDIYIKKVQSAQKDPVLFRRWQQAAGVTPSPPQ